MIRAGGVLYRDRGDDFVIAVIGLNTPRGLSSTFQRSCANGGSDYPESVNSGWDDALQMAWCENAINVIDLVGDASLHDYVDDPSNRYPELSGPAPAREG